MNPNYPSIQDLSLHHLRLLRIGVGIFLVLRILTFFFEVPMHLGPQAWIPVDFFSSAEEHGFKFDLFRVCSTDICTYALLLTMLASAFLLFIERWSKFGCFLSAIFVLSFLKHDNYLAAALDRIALQHLYLLCGSIIVFQLAPYLKLQTEFVGDFFRNLVRLQICIIYLTAGWGKIHSDSWLSGEAIQILTQQTALVQPFILKNNYLLQVLSPILSYAGILFLFSFPLLVHFSKTRKIALLSAFLFHTGIFIIFGNLKLISLLMIFGHSVFLSRSEINYLCRRFSDLKSIVLRKSI